jgi:hypothetical protein
MEIGGKRKKTPKERQFNQITEKVSRIVFCQSTKTTQKKSVIPG